jgi:phasin family protein
MASESSTTDGNTPFSQAANQARKATEDFTRLLSDLKLPALPNVETLLAAHRRNLDTLSAANRIALEGAQAVASRHFEIAQQTMTELSDALRNLAAPGEAPPAKAARQAELLKKAYERTVSNTSEISALIQRSNAEALDLLNKRFTEALEEVKTLVQTPGAPKT